MSVTTRKPGGRLRSRRPASGGRRTAPGATLVFFCVAAADLAAAAAFPVTFHRLRIEYSTTSDWTTLDLENPEGILTVRAMEVKGAPTNSDARADRLALNQPLGAAQAGGEVGMTVDCAIAPEALDRPLVFLLKKGNLNASTVRVLHVGEDGARLLGEAVHRGVVPQSGGTNPLRFTVDLAALKSVRPRRFEVAAVPKMVWAFYYPWYYASSWSRTRLKDLPAKPYSSDDPDAIARQVEEAKSAGIDGFISSWWGPRTYTDNNLKLLLEAARARNFAVSIYFETLKDGGGRSRDEILSWLAYAIAAYGDHPAFMKVNGKPLIVLWASGSVPLATWRDVFAELRARGLDAVYLGMGRNIGNLAVFDGLHEYGVFTIADLGRAMATAARATRNYPLLADVPSPKIWASTAQPGYDETLIQGRSGLVQDRQDGAFFRSTLEAAVASDPDWIFLTTWNEWWEHTYIEPSELYGDRYLRLTRESVEAWKAPPRINDGGVVNAASYAAGPAAPGEIVTIFGTGFGPPSPAWARLNWEGLVDSVLADTRVLFDGVPAPLVAAGRSQVNVVAPYGIAGRSSTSVEVQYRRAAAEPVTVAVAASAPGIFTRDASGKGQAAALNQDGSENSAASPAARGSALVLFATGEGATRPAGVDGKLASDPLPAPELPVRVTMGGIEAAVEYAGGAPGQVAGLLQVNVRIPERVQPGPAVPVVLVIGGAESQAGVTVSVK